MPKPFSFHDFSTAFIRCLTWLAESFAVASGIRIAIKLWF